MYFLVFYLESFQPEHPHCAVYQVSVSPPWTADILLVELHSITSGAKQSYLGFLKEYNNFSLYKPVQILRQKMQLVSCVYLKTL